MTTDNTSREAFAQAVRQFEATLLAANQILIDGAVSPELLELEAARKRLLDFQPTSATAKTYPPIEVCPACAVLTGFIPATSTKPSHIVIVHGDAWMETTYDCAHTGPWNHNEALRRYCETHEISLEGWVSARLRNCDGYAFVQPSRKSPTGVEHADHNPA